MDSNMFSKRVNKKKLIFILGVIFGLALVMRFAWFRQTTYFGFDEARDAFISKEIYTNGDIKLIGPPATGNIGLFHGPLYWYLIGPVYLFLGGDQFMVGAVFRILNSLGVFLTYGIGSLLFGQIAGLLSALLYATSFEQNQYSMYAGKESLAVLCWLGIIYGVLMIYRGHKGKYWGPTIISGCFGLMVQFNLIYFASILPVVILFSIIRRQLRDIPLRFWVLAAVVQFLVLSSYIVSEVRYGFRSFVLATQLIESGFGIMTPGETKGELFGKKFLMMFRDNLIGIDVSSPLLVMIAGIISVWVISKSIKSDYYRIILVWALGWVGLYLVGGHMAYYTHAGLGVSLLVLAANLIENVWRKNLAMGILSLSLIVASNSMLVYKQRNEGLIGGIKPQPGMNLLIETDLIDRMYQVANGRGFTVRLTGIPYKVQTVWAYLFEQYGYKKYGYYPYWENGNVEGFPGYLPPPTSGTTCLRFLVREPMRGLPVALVEADEQTENLFSRLIIREEIKLFVLEERLANDKVCHNAPAQK